MNQNEGNQPLNLKYKALVLMMGILILIPIVINILRIQNFCLNGYDIGIYFQAMLEVDPPEVWNPHLSIRGIKAFNDHFNPVMIPVAQFLKLFGDFSPVHVIVFEWSIWVFSLFLFWKLMSDWSLKLRILALFLVITAKGALTPLYFPVHVDYWAMPLWIGLTWAAYQARWRLFLSCLFAICFFKESYPIAFLFTGLTLLYLRQRALAFSTLIFCGVFTYWNLILRPVYLGPIHGHGTKLIKEILADPMGYLPLWWDRMPIGTSIEIYLVPFVFLGFAFRRAPAPTAILLSAIVPLFGLQVLAGLMPFQYPYPMMATGFTAAIATGILQEWVNNRKALIALLIFSAAPGLTQHFNYLSLFWIRDTNCQFLPGKRAEFRFLEEAVKREEASLKSSGHTAVIAATGGIATNLLTKGRDLRHIMSFSLIADQYDLLALETGAVSFAYPIDLTKIAKIQQTCEPFRTEVLHSGEHFALWKGKFPAKCIYQWPSGAPNVDAYGPYKPWGQLE